MTGAARNTNTRHWVSTCTWPAPEQVVEQFVALKEAGVDGVQLTFYGFAPNLEYFGEAVLRLMQEVGLRVG